MKAENEGGEDEGWARALRFHSSRSSSPNRLPFLFQLLLLLLLVLLLRFGL